MLGGMYGGGSGIGGMKVMVLTGGDGLVLVVWVV